MSRLRAKCPDCKTHTAVALGPEYQCHSCGREFAAGLVRVPRAWGSGGKEMARAASLPLPYPEAAVIEEPTLGEQTLAVAAELPERPIVVGGCCCSHVGAAQALASRHDRIAVVWLDAHGDLNTEESSPSGNPWGMPLRMIIDAGAVHPTNVVLVGARDLDPPEQAFIAESGIRLDEEGLDAALDGTNGVYVALDCDALEETEVASYMPEPGGLTIAEVGRLFNEIRERAPVLGAGVSGWVDDPRNVEPVSRLLTKLGM